MRSKVTLLALLLILAFAHNLTSTYIPPVYYIIHPSWITPPNLKGQGTVGLEITYSTVANARVFAVQLTVILPPGVTNSTGGSYITAFFSTQMPIYYNFNVSVNSFVNKPLLFTAFLTFYVSYNNETVVEEEQSNFTLPYYGTVGAEVTTNTSFVHFGFNKIPIKVIDEGTAELLNVTLEVDGQSISIPKLHSNFTTDVMVYVPPSNTIWFTLPVKLTYETPYGTEGSLYKVLDFIVLENTSPVVITYYNFLSPRPHYLDVGENYVEFNITNNLGLTINSSWLLVLQNNSVIKAYFIKIWHPLQTVTVFLAINTSSPQDIGFELYSNGRIYNLTSVKIPLINSPRLTLNVTTKNGEEFLEVTNELGVNVTNVTIEVLGENITFDVIKARGTASVKLNATINATAYIKFKALDFVLTEERVIRVIAVGSPNLVVYYYVFRTTNPHVLFLTIGVINEGNGTAYNAFLLLNLNDTLAQVNPYVIHIGTLQPGSPFYQSVTLYMGSPLPKVVDIPSEIVYNDGADLKVKNYTIVVNVYSLYHYNNLFTTILEYLGYSVYGIPLLFIIAVVVFIVILLIPSRRKK